MKFTKLFEPLIKTLFPPVCNVCGKKLDDYQKCLCDDCMSNLPLTNNWHVPHNLIYDRLKEGADVVAAVTLFHYTAGDPYSNIILNAKFRNQRSLASEMGRVMGRYIRNSEVIKGVDYIIALPLHPSRKRWRGYNQSDYFALGMSEVLGIPILKDTVIRDKKSDTQSKMRGRKVRQENVKGIFKVVNKGVLENKRIVLLDDVITTGATISSCAHTIKKAVSTVDIVAAAICSTK